MHAQVATSSISVSKLHLLVTLEAIWERFTTFGEPVGAGSGGQHLATAVPDSNRVSSDSKGAALQEIDLEQSPQQCHQRREDAYDTLPGLSSSEVGIRFLAKMHATPWFHT